MALQPSILRFRVDGFVRVPEVLSGAQLRHAQEAFAAATAGLVLPGEVALLPHLGEFLGVLGLSDLLALAAELMPTRYEGLPQCVSLTGHTAPTTNGWRRDYARPVKDIVLYGPAAPPQHMTDSLKVFIALQDQPMDLLSFGSGSHRMAGAPSEASASVWEAKAGDAMLVDGRTWYNDDSLGSGGGGGAFLAFEYRSTKEKNEEMVELGLKLEASGALAEAGEMALHLLGLGNRGATGGGANGSINTGGLPVGALDSMMRDMPGRSQAML